MRSLRQRRAYTRDPIHSLLMRLLVLLAVSASFSLTPWNVHHANAQGRDTVAIHLLDVFEAENAKQLNRNTDSEPSVVEWGFNNSNTMSTADAVDSNHNWEAGPGVSELMVRNGLLTGRSSNAYPIIQLTRIPGTAGTSQICAFEIRMRVSAGSRVFAVESSSDSLNLEESAASERIFPISAPLIADNNMHTYLIRTRFPIPKSSLRRLLIRPTDVEGARFEIEFVRALTRKEFFLKYSPVVSFQGLSAVFRQSLGTRSSDKVSIPLSLPERPWLDLAIGTLNEHPVTFNVQIHHSKTQIENVSVLSRTISEPDRWHPVQIDLSEFATQDVEISFSVESEEDDVIGLWGSPVLRNNRSAVSEDKPQGVILIWADALRWDHLDVYGYPRETAPNLSRLAKEGALFQDCVSQATWTLPSTASLLTSSFQTTHGIVDKFKDVLPFSATLMPEVFQDAGYATVSYSSVWFVGRYFNMHQGFDESHEFDSVRGNHDTAKEYIDRLLPWIETHREVPFFVFMHLLDPHAPYEPAPPYNTIWGDDERKDEYEQHIEKVKDFITDPQRKKLLSIGTNWGSQSLCQQG